MSVSDNIIYIIATKLLLNAPLLHHNLPLILKRVHCGIIGGISNQHTLSPPMPMMTATMMMMTYRPFLMTDDEIGRRLALLDGDDDDREETAMERLRGGDVGEEEDDLFLANDTTNKRKAVQVLTHSDSDE